jgi:protein-S-isoprenylcysteine O-methyltransferase Ste14
MIILGGALIVVCVGLFGLWGNGTPSPLAPTSQLVILGPYRYVRNPIHIGQLVFFVGLGLYLRSVAVILFALAWLLFCHLYVVLIEEGRLKRKFGAPYEEYCKAVPRWFPSAPFRERVRSS